MLHSVFCLLLFAINDIIRTFFSIQHHHQLVNVAGWPSCDLAPSAYDLKSCVTKFTLLPSCLLMQSDGLISLSSSRGKNSHCWPLTSRGWRLTMIPRHSTEQDRWTECWAQSLHGGPGPKCTVRRFLKLQDSEWGTTACSLFKEKRKKNQQKNKITWKWGGRSRISLQWQPPPSSREVVLSPHLAHLLVPNKRLCHEDLRKQTNFTPLPGKVWRHHGLQKTGVARQVAELHN